MMLSVKRRRVLAVVLSLAFPATLACAGEAKLGDRTFVIPDGFAIERVAGPPLVERPITAAFDDEGRLYVADSSGSNDNVQKQLAEQSPSNRAAGRHRRRRHVRHARRCSPTR